jgi:hypothetical protein
MDLTKTSVLHRPTLMNSGDLCSSFSKWICFKLIWIPNVLTKSLTEWQGGLPTVWYKSNGILVSSETPKFKTFCLDFLSWNKRPGTALKICPWTRRDEIAESLCVISCHEVTEIASQTMKLPLIYQFINPQLHLYLSVVYLMMLPTSQTDRMIKWKGRGSRRGLI